MFVYSLEGRQDLVSSYSIGNKDLWNQANEGWVGLNLGGRKEPTMLLNMLWIDIERVVNAFDMLRIDIERVVWDLWNQISEGKVSISVVNYVWNSKVFFG